MLKNLFKKNKTLDKVITSEVDVALRLMFEIAISDGSLDKNELDLIKKTFSGHFLKSHLRCRQFFGHSLHLLKIIRPLFENS